MNFESTTTIKATFELYRRIIRLAENSPLERIAWLRRLHRRIMSSLRPAVVDVDGFRIQLDSTDAMRLTTSTSRPFGLQHLLSRLRPGDGVIDIGAHIGYYTLLISRQIGSTGHAFAIEADPDTHDLLQRNLTTNAIANVTSFNLAATAQPGTATLYRSTCSALNRLHPSSHCSRQLVIPARPLDGIEELFTRPINCIKIDVEGHEIEVLEGARRLLVANPTANLFVEFAPCWLEEAGQDATKYFEALKHLSMEVLHVDDERGLVERANLRELLQRFPATSQRTTNLWCQRGSRRPCLNESTH